VSDFGFRKMQYLGFVRGNLITFEPLARSEEQLMHVLLDAKSSSCEVFVDIMSVHAWPPKLKFFQCYMLCSF
jgi:hypothetical protein